MVMRTAISKTTRNACWLLVIAIAVACTLVFAGQAMADANAAPIVVSLGDSYSSGEGVEAFIDEGDYSSEDFLAHRSENAWPGMLTVNGSGMVRNQNWFFVAASGAQTCDVMPGICDETDQEHRDAHNPQTITWDRGNNKDSKTLDYQIDVFKNRSLRGMVDYVTITMGGNDVGFVNVLSEACLDDVPFLSIGHSLPKAILDAIKEFDGGTNGRRSTRECLRMVYTCIEDEAGPQATILVAGYPHLFAYEGELAVLSPEEDDIQNKYNRWSGAAGVDAEEARLINRAVDYFDAGIRETVLGMSSDNIVFVDVRPYFNGHEAEYINPMWNYPQDYDLSDNGASSYSVHPNLEGQKAYARAVQETINYLEDSKRGVPTAEIDIPSELNMALVFDVSGSMGDWSAASGVTKLESAERQSMDFVSSVSGSQGGPGGVSVRVGVSTFSDYAVRVCGLSNDPDVINGSIDGLQTYNMTNIYAGLDEGISQLAGEDGEKLIVLLSDGLSNEGGSNEDIIQLAREAGQLGIRVYTIGFGSSGDLDEDLLREIASVTGGAYAHEDSSDISAATVGLFAQMMSAQLQATSQVLMDTTGAVAQGGTSQVGSFDVTQNGTVTAYLYWPGSVLDLQLTDPNGVVVDEGYAGCTIDTTSIPTRVTVENARQGTWGVAVYGRETSMAEEPFYVAASFNETEVPVIPAGSGAATDNGTVLLFLLAAVGIASVTLVVALSKRRG